MFSGSRLRIAESLGVKRRPELPEDYRDFEEILMRQVLKYSLFLSAAFGFSDRLCQGQEALKESQAQKQNVDLNSAQPEPKGTPDVSAPVMPIPMAGHYHARCCQNARSCVHRISCCAGVEHHATTNRCCGTRRQFNCCDQSNRAFGNSCQKRGEHTQCSQYGPVRWTSALAVDQTFAIELLARCESVNARLSEMIPPDPVDLIQRTRVRVLHAR